MQLAFVVQSIAMKRFFLFILIASAFVYFWQAFNEIPLRVIGQPSSTGLLQREKEAPFFAQLRAATRIPLQVVYQPLESVAFKDTFQLQMLKEGQFDLVSLRFIQNSALEPTLEGIDLVGMIPDYVTARKVIAAYSPKIDRNLQEKFNAKLLGIWSFGPQEFFCNKPITRLEDIKGLKVRIGGQAMSAFILALEGVPAVIPFDDTKNALAIGLIDCAITSAASANTARWLEHSKYTFPLAVQFGLNGYAISLSKWKSLSSAEQRLLAAAFETYTADLWQYTQAIQIDASSCNTGGPCERGNRFNASAIKPSSQDVQLIRDIMRRSVLPGWGAKCDQVHPGCAKEWQDELSALIGP